MAFHFPTPSLLDHGFVHRQLLKIHDALGHVGAAAHSPELVHAVTAAIEDARNDPEPRGDYYSHNPLVSLIQSALDAQLRTKQVTGEVEHTDERMGDPFTHDDIRWITDVAVSLVRRLIDGSHAFNDAPATVDLEPNARLVIIGDWGTGQAGAALVARTANAYIRGPQVDRPVHVIHLGDTYYSGTPTEQRNNLLTPWPVAPSDAKAVSSWALNGNHDMYSGGHGLFEVTLGDPRFDRQRANGQPTSWFVLRGPRWNVLGLDTAWRNSIVELDDGRLSFVDANGHLNGSQPETLGTLAREEQRLLVLSHHQLFNAYDAYPLPLAGEVQGSLAGRTVASWFWGHEHDCLAYASFDGVGAARAIGNSAVPMEIRTNPADPIDGGPLVKPDVDPTLPAHHPMRALTWEYRDSREGSQGSHWMKHAFAVVDIDGDTLTVRFIDDEGTVFKQETI